MPNYRTGASRGNKAGLEIVDYCCLRLFYFLIGHLFLLTKFFRPQPSSTTASLEDILARVATF